MILYLSPKEEKQRGASDQLGPAAIFPKLPHDSHDAH